jgi:micrococcal nuclease
LGRLIVFLLLAALVVYVVRAIAPLIVLAALLLLVVAWRWPARLAGVLASARLAILPDQLRATPLAFAGTVAAGALALLWVASAVGGSASSAAADEPRPTTAAAVATTPAAVVPAITTASVEPSSQATKPPSPTPSTVATEPDEGEAEPEPSLGIGLAPTGPTQVAQVVSITDGDTIRVQFGGHEYPVRYIGMDTPETHFGIEPLGPAAADANARLVADKQVVLEKDVSETDKYGRLLRDVWLHDGSGWLLVNLELVRLGFAQVATYPPDVKYTDSLLLPAQRAARAACIGLWGSGEPASSATPAATAPRGLVGGSCEPSYPDICVPLDSPDLDCGDISARRFRVLWDVPNPDPDRFDGNHDGIGCQG